MVVFAGIAAAAAIWPLNDLYNNPWEDITGNGNDAYPFTLGYSRTEIPGTNVRGIHFDGSRSGYIDVGFSDPLELHKSLARL